MALVKHVEQYPLSSIRGGMSYFYTPQTSHETILVHVPGNTIEDLFTHQSHTDQLLVVRGRFVLVVLQNRQYRYLPMDAEYPTVVRIPPGVPHGAINFDSHDCVLVNALLRHCAPSDRDYVPIKPPLPYDLEAARAVLEAIPLAA